VGYKYINLAMRRLTLQPMFALLSTWNLKATGLTPCVSVLPERLAEYLKSCEVKKLYAVYINIGRIAQCKNISHWDSVVIINRLNIGHSCLTHLYVAYSAIAILWSSVLHSLLSTCLWNVETWMLSLRFFEVSVLKIFLITAYNAYSWAVELKH